MHFKLTNLHNERATGYGKQTTDESRLRDALLGRWALRGMQACVSSIGDNTEALWVPAVRQVGQPLYCVHNCPCVCCVRMRWKIAIKCSWQYLTIGYW